MLNSYRKKEKSEEGFTLLELLIVIGILAVLTSVAVLYTATQREKAAKAQVISDLRGIAPLMEDYELTFLRYPEFLPDYDRSDGVLMELSEDGTCITGTHEAYDNIIWYYDSVRNVVTDGGCNPPPEDDPLLGVVDAAVYAGNYFTSTNAWTIRGEGADLYVDGDYECNSNVTSEGDLIVQGDVYLTNNCHVGGNVYATGDVAMTSNVHIGGSILTLKTVSMANTCGGGLSACANGIRVDGDIKTFYAAGENGYGGDVDIIVVGDRRGDITAHNRLNGPSDLRADGSQVVGGQLIIGDPDIEIPEIPFPKLYFNPNPTARQMSYSEFWNDNAPDFTWGGSRPVTCNFSNASWGAGFGTVSAPIYIDETVILDATECDASGGLTMSGHDGPVTFVLNADLTIYVNKFSGSVGGFNFISGDGERHNVRIISPLPAGAETPADVLSNIDDYGINVASAPITTGENIALLLYSPGLLHFGNGTTISGQAIGGGIRTSGTVIIDYVKIGEW